MNNRLIYFSYAVAGAAIFAGSLQAFYPYGSGELFVKAVPELHYDSNIYARDGGEEDWVARVPVGLLLVQDAGYIRAEADVGVEFGVFKENGDEDYEDPFARARFVYDRDGHPLRSQANLGWWQETRADPAVGQRPQVERRLVSLNNRYRLSQRLGLRGGVDYADWDYDSGSLTDRERYGLQIGGEYSYSPRLDIGLNYSYDESETTTVDANNLSSQDHGVYLSIRGELTPRITQTIEVGAKRRTFEGDDLEASTEPYAALSLLWQIDEPTSLRLTGLSDFSYSAENSSVLGQRIELRLRRQIDPKIGVSVNTFYANEEFEYVARAARTDELFGVGADLDYTFTQLVSGSLGVVYTDRTSDIAFANYDRILVSASVLFQY